MHPPGTDKTVVAVRTCRLRLTDEPWDYARRHAAEIDAHWARRLADNPAFFNGVVYLTTAYSIVDGTLDARCVSADFKNYLYWRERDDDRSIIDAFGSALIVSADGAVLLGRQRAGNLNGNLCYCPSGLIDTRDVRDDGTIDISASVRRELMEETGLTLSDVTEVPGFLVTRIGGQMSIARELRAVLDAEPLRNKILSAFASDPHSELTDIVVVRSLADAEALDTPRFVRLLLAHRFASQPVQP